MQVAAYMLSCAARDRVRSQTLARLARTDWDAEAVVVLDEAQDERPQDRQCQTARRLLEIAARDGADYVLFFEDDLDFNRHLRHNLAHWQPLAGAAPGGHLLASLYDPGVAARAWDHGRAFSVAHPDLVYGSQALLLSQATVLHVLKGWERVAGMQDMKLSRLASEVTPIYYHRPSLVQHVVAASTWGGPAHWARDFSASWRARALTPERSARTA